MQDLRYALRQMRGNPWFTTVTVLVLALTLGANAAVFSVVNAVLLRPLPFPDADRVVQIWETNLSRGQAEQVVSPTISSTGNGRARPSPTWPFMSGRARR